MTRSNTGPVGSFRYECASGTWWWSEPVYEIHGFTPGEVVPTIDLIVSHHHPEDAPAVGPALRIAIERGETFSLWHRIVDARRNVRQVLTVGGGVRDGSGLLTEIQGYLVDLTDARRRTLVAAVDQAVRSSAESRAVIEQAKGVLMLVYRIEEDTAFELLRSCSQRLNVKVRDICADLVDCVRATGSIPPDLRHALDALGTEDTFGPAGTGRTALTAQEGAD